MGMKRFVFALCLLFLLAGCKQKAAEPFLQATALPVQTPAAVEERQAEVKASFAPTATPLFTSSPAPTLTPSPTPTPDPFAGVEKVVLEEDPRFYYAELTQALKERITGLSYPAEGESCRVSYEDLRYVGLIYVDYEGQERIGELMVHKKVAAEVMEIFYQLYTAAYPLASVRLVDDYGHHPSEMAATIAASPDRIPCLWRITTLPPFAIERSTTVKSSAGTALALL